MKFLVTIFMLFPIIVVGDTWQYPPERTVTEYTFGDTKVLRIVDATENQLYPDFIVDIYTSGELVGRYRGIHFERLSATPNNQVFVGISNSGLPGTALVIFDANGTLRLLLDHQFDSDRFTYCDQSVTLIREWYDESDPNLQLGDGKDGPAFQVRACDGNTLTLSDLNP